MGRHEWKLLVHPKGPAGDGANRVTGRKIAEELAAVVIHARSGPDDHLAGEELGLPRRAQPRPDAPLPACQRGGAYAAGAVRVVAGDDETRIVDRVGRLAIAVELRVEVEDASLLLGQTAVPVVAQTRGERERGGRLKLGLNVGADLVRAIVTAARSKQQGAR